MTSPSPKVAKAVVVVETVGDTGGNLPRTGFREEGMVERSASDALPKKD